VFKHLQNTVYYLKFRSMERILMEEDLEYFIDLKGHLQLFS